MRYSLVTLLFCVPLLVLFFCFSYPLGLSTILVLLTLLVRLSVGAALPRFWLGYRIVLIILRGLIIIFVYIALLTSNEIFVLSLSKTKILLVSVLLTSFISVTSSQTPDFQALLTFEDEPLTWLASLYGRELGGLTLFLVLYLFLTLFVIMAVTRGKQTTLRRI